MNRSDGPFSLVRSGQTCSVSKKLVLNCLQTVLGLDGMNEYYRRISCHCPERDFATRALEVGNVTCRLTGSLEEQLPKSGSVVVVANHPFGGLEGIILLSLLNQFRQDTRVMANYMLSCIPDLRNNFIFVDPFGTNDSAKKNLRPLRETIDWLKKGGAVGVFPAGAVSHFHWRSLEVTDPPWDPIIARIIRISRTPVIPLYFSGRNRLLFQIFGMIHPRLRTAMLPRELLNKHGTTIDIKVGSLIPSEKLAAFESDEDLLSYLRLRTYILGSQQEGEQRKRGKFDLKGFFQLSVKESEIIPPVAATSIEHEVRSLPENQKLLEQMDYQVLFAHSGQIPNTLREIGRLREVTFRQAKEGTGKSIDLDKFDDYYTHLFLYNFRSNEIAGAYRLVDARWAARVFGLKGLYTHTLFDYNQSLLDQMGPALELGRSFIRAEYQRNYNSLNLLWKGIAHYVYRHPQYTGLFGTVSISSEYDSISRQLIMLFLKENNSLPQLAKLIRARNPMRKQRLRGIDTRSTSMVVKDLEEVNQLLTELRSQHRSIPILLRQYLRLNGKLLGFNVDKSFGNVLDGLIYVDLRETDPRILERYLGKQAAQDYLSSHQPSIGCTKEKTGTRG